MLKFRHVVILSGMLLCAAASADQVSIGIGLPNLSIGINLRAYPDLVVVPGYPVYYAPQEDENLFFYDGMYWVYQDDEWYASTWYNGPWSLVDRDVVPLFVLRIPVRYYRHPPTFFLGWRSDAPPRWGDRWGHDWEQHRKGWDRWNRGAIPVPAPLPTYQRQYSGDRYPQQVEQQHEFQRQHYRYQPSDPVVRKHVQNQSMQHAPAWQERQSAPEDRGYRPQNIQRTAPQDQDRAASPAAPTLSRPDFQDRGQPQQAEPGKRERQTPVSRDRDERRQGRDAPPDSARGQDQERGRGHGRND